MGVAATATSRTSHGAQIQVAEAATGNIEGERKIATALFADSKGSMDLMEDIDPEEARTIVDPALKLMMGAMHRYDGYIVQSTGDGIFALFGGRLRVPGGDAPLLSIAGGSRCAAPDQPQPIRCVTQGFRPVSVHRAAHG
ncbi:MAG: hypothetical protein ACREQX_06430 [Candidatus Binataceae bacterium]